MTFACFPFETALKVPSTAAGCTIGPAGVPSIHASGTIALQEVPAPGVCRA